jgi:hypothetical protein
MSVALGIALSRYGVYRGRRLSGICRICWGRGRHKCARDRCRPGMVNHGGGMAMVMAVVRLAANAESHLAYLVSRSE